MKVISGRIQRFFIAAYIILSLIWISCSDSNNFPVAVTSDTANRKEMIFPKIVNASYLKEDSMASFLAYAKKVRPNKNASAPFNMLDYDKVIAYDYEGGKSETLLYIIEEGKLAGNVQHQKELSQKQVNQLTNYLGDPSTYGGSKAFCFEPHLGIVFYKDNSIVAHISICLDCNYLSSSLTIPATQVQKIKIGDDFEYPAEGFSKSGRRKINALCKELLFSHCKDTLNAMFE